MHKEQMQEPYEEKKKSYKVITQTDSFAHYEGDYKKHLTFMHIYFKKLPNANDFVLFLVSFFQVVVD